MIPLSFSLFPQLGTVRFRTLLCWNVFLVMNSADTDLCFTDKEGKRRGRAAGCSRGWTVILPQRTLRMLQIIIMQLKLWRSQRGDAVYSDVEYIQEVFKKHYSFLGVNLFNWILRAFVDRKHQSWKYISSQKLNDHLSVLHSESYLV